MNAWARLFPETLSFTKIPSSEKQFFHICAYSCQASFWLLSQNTSCWRPHENRKLSPTVLKAEKCKPQAWAEPVSSEGCVVSWMPPLCWILTAERKINSPRATRALSHCHLLASPLNSRTMNVDFTWGILKVTCSGHKGSLNSKLYQTL